MSEPKEDESSTASPPPFPLDDEQQEQSGEANTLYKYRDFSTMPEEQDAEEDNSPSKQGSLESSIRVQKFPVKLYAILAQKEFHDIISWMPHGRSWKVLKPNLFESMVMPLFFEYSNYHSFNRLVNAWSFRRISSGPDRGSYYHELFLRGKPHLQKYMRRLPKTHKKLPMKKEDEPDFYKMDKEASLPPLEDIPLSASKMQGGIQGHQSLALTPLPVSQGSMNSMQRSTPRIYHETSQQDGFDSQDGGYTPGGRSTAGGMRDPAKFKPMEFKPVSSTDGMGMNPQMMMGGPQMNPQMGGMGINMNSMEMSMNGMGMGSPMMMGCQQMSPQMMMGGPHISPQMMMGGPQMNPQIGGMGSMSMNGTGMMGNPMMMGGQHMNPQMNQMGTMSPMSSGGSNSQQFYMQRLRQMQMMNGSMPMGNEVGGDFGCRMGSFNPQHC